MALAQQFSSVVLSLFDDKFERDEREPVLIFSLPASNASFGFIAPSLSFWFQFFLIAGLQSVIGVIAACFIYNFIIKKRGSTTALLAGYGFALPFSLAVSFFLYRILDLQNMSFLILGASTSTLCFFRCFEAMYGTSPAAVEHNMVTYCLYYCSVIQFNFDAKSKHPIRATSKEVRTKAILFLRNFMLIGFLYSVMIPWNYLPFPTPITLQQSDQQSPWSIFHWGHLMNNFMLAYLTYCALDTASLGVGTAISFLSGNSVLTVNHDPLFKSVSLSDFWGRRWNQLIHGALKRGVFKSLRKHFSRPTATALTFAASGFLHEYIIWVISLKNESSSYSHLEYIPRYGSHFAFFGWNGGMMLLEHMLTGCLLFVWIQTNLPRPIITALVILTVLPVSHWFTHEYVKSGFYNDFSIGFPKVVSVSVPLLSREYV